MAGDCRLVPWESWREWDRVREALFSDSPARLPSALRKIAGWHSRRHLPVAVEVTAELITIQQQDPCFSNPAASYSEEMLRLMYAMAIMRLINGVVDRSRKQNSKSVAWRAEAAGMPHLLVDVRHGVAHKELPGISLLRLASKRALEWLKVQYWDAQKHSLDDARVCLKSKLFQCALHFHDKEQRLAGSRKRKEPDKDLVIAVNSAVSETVSILVDDCLLERVSAGDRSVREICGDPKCSKLPPEDVFKRVLALLCCNIPHFTSLLVVRLFEELVNAHGENSERVFRISSHKRETTCNDFVDNDNAKKWGSINPEIKEKNLNITEYDSLLPECENLPFSDTCKSSREHHLIAWIKWLLTPRAGNMKQDEQVLYKPNELAMRTDSDFVDLPLIVVKELLYVCLRSEIDKQTRVELVNLLAEKFPSKKNSRKAVALASLTCPDTQNEICVKANEQGRLVIDEEEIELSLSKSEAALKESRERLKLLCNDRGRHVSKASLKAALDHESSPRKFESENPFGAFGYQNAKISQLHGSWSLAEEWTPCPIGMIPSTLCGSRQVPSFDLVGMNHQLGTSADCKAALDNETNQQFSVRPNSFTSEKSPVANIMDLKGKNVMAGSHTDEVAPVKQIVHKSDKIIADASFSEGNIKIGPTTCASPLQGLLLIDGIYQTCDSAQLSAIQSAIHIM